VAAFPVNHMVSPKEQKDMLHATYRLKIAIYSRNKRHFPLRETGIYELGMLMKRPDKLKQPKVGFKRFC
jgi:hypothetical protein